MRLKCIKLWFGWPEKNRARRIEKPVLFGKYGQKSKRLEKNMEFDGLLALCQINFVTLSISSNLRSLIISRQWFVCWVIDRPSFIDAFFTQFYCLLFYFAGYLVTRSPSTELCSKAKR